MAAKLCKICNNGKKASEYHLENHHDGMSRDAYDMFEAAPATNEVVEDTPPEPVEETVPDPVVEEAPVAETNEAVPEVELWFTHKGFFDKKSGWSFMPGVDEPKPLPAELTYGIKMAQKAGLLHRYTE